MKKVTCSASPGCQEQAIGCCDICGKAFCDDHGAPGGDREVEGGVVAVPSVCVDCVVTD